MKTLFSLPVRRSAELGAFNPALPTDGSLVVADVLRDFGGHGFGKFRRINRDSLA